MKLTANVIGATGLVGSQLVKQLTAHPGFSKVRLFVRRPTGFNHPKIEENIVEFNKPETWEKLLDGDILFSALGTTVKQAGSKEKEYEVDFTYNLNFARAAFNRGIPVYVLVSSAGANPKSAIFYSRMKGQLDEAVMNLGFRKTVILRPSILDGDRNKKRTTEKIAVKIANVLTRIIMKNYRPIKDVVVARAMINTAIAPTSKSPQRNIYTAGEIFGLAGD